MHSSKKPTSRRADKEKQSARKEKARVSFVNIDSCNTFESK
jgi:hypothetical protein